MLSKGMDRKNFFLAWLLCAICAGVAGCYMVSVSMRNDAYYPIWAMAMYCFIGSFFGGLFMHGWMQGNKVFWGEEADMGKAGVMLFMALFFMDLILLANGSNFAFREALKNGEVVSCKMEIRRGDFYCMGSAEKISLKEEDKEIVDSIVSINNSKETNIDKENKPNEENDKPINKKKLFPYYIAGLALILAI